MSGLTHANPGFGLGLRTQHYPDFLATPQPVDWLEIISDNYLVPGGKPLAMLEKIRAHYPMVMHGVAMSLAAPQGLDTTYLRRIKTLADRIEPLWISDHLCWIGTTQQELHDLNPVPYTDEAASRIITAINQAQDMLGRRLVIENVSSYVQFKDSVCAEWQFLSYVAQEADCLLLLDVNNVYVSSVNHRFDPLDYLRGLPAQRIQQIHLAGHSVQHDGYIIDTHDHPVSEAVWELYRAALQLFGPVATMVERDDHIPPLPELLSELQTAKQIAQSVHAVPPQSIHTLPQKTHLNTQPNTQPKAPLSTLQNQWIEAIVHSTVSVTPAPTPVPAPLPAITQTLQPSHRFAVYHHAYAARLTEVLADVYEKTYLYMGSDLFETIAQEYVRAHPPTSRHLRDYGASWVKELNHRYPNNPELCELAQLDWDLRQTFDSPDEAVLTISDVAQDQDPNQDWLHAAPPLLSHTCLRPVTHSVTAIWHAIHNDADVPAPIRLEEPTYLLVWRKNFQPHFQSVSGLHAQLLLSLHSGASIAQSFAQYENQIQQQSATFATQTLQSWLGDALLVKRQAG